MLDFIVSDREVHLPSGASLFLAGDMRATVAERVVSPRGEDTRVRLTGADLDFADGLPQADYLADVRDRAAHDFADDLRHGL